MAMKILLAVFGVSASMIAGLGLGNFATDGVAASVPPPPAYREIAAIDVGEDDYRY